MAVNPVRSTTGSTNLPDLGILSYNGVTFSALYKTRIGGEAVRDEAGRTIKYMKYVIDVEGYVTKNAGDNSVDNTWVAIRELLDAQAGVLTYDRKGFGPLIVNAPGGALRDVAWGPLPTTLDFQPLGASNSAIIHWVVVVCLPEYTKAVFLQAAAGLGSPAGGRPGSGGGGGLFGTKPGRAAVAGSTAGAGAAAGLAGLPPVLQFNYEISIGYDEDGYCNLSLRGILEVPLTRATQMSRNVPYTVDDYRFFWLDRVADSFNLTNFKVTKRTFNISRDRRTMDWEFVAEEQAPMNLPPGATRARGTFSVRPQKQGMGLVNWICSLRCTYTIRKDQPRRLAWAAFISLLAYRMKAARFGSGPIPTKQQGIGQLAAALDVSGISSIVLNLKSLIPEIKRRLSAQEQNDNKPPAGVVTAPGGVQLGDAKRAFLLGFEIDEGLYDDSRTITFGATWWLITTMASILRATGVWRWDRTYSNENLWAVSMRDIQGWRSWQQNPINAAADAIVDFGS